MMLRLPKNLQIIADNFKEILLQTAFSFSLVKKSMKRKILKLLLAPIYVFIFGCSKDDGIAVNDGNCIIEKITSEEFVYEYKYNVRGDLFIVNQEFRLTEPNPTFLRVYVKTISPDSITIGRLRNDFQQDPPRIAVQYTNGNVSEVKRFFTSGETNILTFEYSAEKIRISVDYDSGDGGMQKVAFGDYFLDGNNISKVEKYEYGADPNVAELVVVKSYTYDTANNPWKGLVFPVFFCPELPEARFFSANNVLTENVNGQETELQYDYDGETTIGGNVLLFNACESPTEKIQERYSYINCGNE